MNQIRKVSLSDLIGTLRQQQARKFDVVVPATRLRAHADGTMIVSGVEAQITENGVTTIDGLYRPTQQFIEGLSGKLQIPGAYLRRLHTERPDLFATLVEGHLHGEPGGYDPDTRTFLFRGFTGEGDEPGEARALLSDSYKFFDHLDALTAALTGVQRAGAAIEVESADLTERRMIVRLTSPNVKAYGGSLVENYRSPFSGLSGKDLPMVRAGLVLSNSETGGGAFTLVPRFTFEVCGNGMTITKDATRAVHLGGKMDEGLIRWSEETQRTNADLVAAKAADAIATFLDVNYMKRVLAQMQEKANKPVSSIEEVRVIGKTLAFTEEQIDGVLGMFVKGGQMTAGGVLNAVTAYAKTVEDGDLSFELEALSTKVLETV